MVELVVGVVVDWQPASRTGRQKNSHGRDDRQKPGRHVEVAPCRRLEVARLAPLGRPRTTETTKSGSMPKGPGGRGQGRGFWGWSAPGLPPVKAAGRTPGAVHNVKGFEVEPSRGTLLTRSLRTALLQVCRQCGTSSGRMEGSSDTGKAAMRLQSSRSWQRRTRSYSSSGSSWRCTSAP